MATTWVYEMADWRALEKVVQLDEKRDVQMVEMMVEKSEIPLDSMGEM